MLLTLTREFRACISDREVEARQTPLFGTHPFTIIHRIDLKTTATY